tara:strand:+ start:459 stop:812 length:354 start_codon:yes stop_codon:yes gene_type:complete
MGILINIKVKILKHFTIAYKDDDDNFCEICEYAERSDEAIKNAINDIPVLKNNNKYIFRCTNESDLEWLLNMERLSNKEWDRDSLKKEGRFLLLEIKGHITHIFHWLKTSIKSRLDF